MGNIEFLSIREYAKKLNLSKETVRNWCNSYDGKKMLDDDGFEPVKVDTTWILYRVK